MAGSRVSLEIMLRFGSESPLGMAVMEDKKGDPRITTYRPLSNRSSSSDWTIVKVSVEYVELGL